MEAARDYPGVRISAALVPADSPLLGQDADGIQYTSGLEKALSSSDVLVDFSTPASTAMAVDACVSARTPIVIGVTGLDAQLSEKLTTACGRIPVLVAPNMSLGAVLLQQLAHTAAAVLGEDYAVEITDQHHRHKKDAPSGTALALGETVASARGVPLKEHAVFEGSGRNSAPQPGSIRFSSIRRDEIVGDHTVVFIGGTESLELTHRAMKRTAFARGALAAARWVVDKPAGCYGMLDVLDLHVR